MSRKRVIQEIKRILYLPGVKIEGMYTHLSAADCKDRTHTLLQLELFDSLINDLKKEKIELEICNAVNSAGILEYPNSHYDMIRAGVSMYGLYPSNEMDRSRVKLIPAMTLKSIISSIQSIQISN